MTELAAPLSLILLALGCDAGEPKTASADTPVVAAKAWLKAHGVE